MSASEKIAHSYAASRPHATSAIPDSAAQADNDAFRTRPSPAAGSVTRGQAAKGLVVTLTASSRLAAHQTWAR